jgi:hypothetical protein
MGDKARVAGWLLLAAAVVGGAALALLAPPDANACRVECADGRIG